MLVITLLFNIFYTSNVFATNLNINILSVLKINSMITDINSVVNLSANDQVELNIPIAIKIYKLEMKLILICY